MGVRSFGDLGGPRDTVSVAGDCFNLFYILLQRSGFHKEPSGAGAIHTILLYGLLYTLLSQDEIQGIFIWGSPV